MQSRYYDATICRFINADGYVSTGQGVIGNNMFAYCNNNPVMGYDPTGEYCVANKDGTDTNYLDDWLIEGAGAGGYGGTGNYFGYGTSYYSYSIRNYSSATNIPRYYNVTGAVSVNDGMAVGSSGTTIIYRSVSSAEALDIKNTGQFNISPNGMDCKQFGFDYGETAQFGQKVGQNIIVSARIPTSSLGRFYTQGVDTSIFRHGTLTVYGDDIGYFNQLIAGTIVFYR